MIDCITTLLLSPGVAQIFYGDETGRKLSDARFNVDSDQAFRSDMNWNDIDSTLLAHVRKLGNIRLNNPVIGSGRQRTLNAHTCVRYNATDTVLICVNPENYKSIPTAEVFADGTMLTDLYTHNTAVARDGKVSFPFYANHVAIIVASRPRKSD